MSKKDAYWFSHDANAQDDPKCMLLIDQLGMEGYGIFWALVEKLRAEKEHKLPLSVVPSFARRWATSSEKVVTVISKFGLFIIEEEFFFSVRLKKSMTEKSEKARLSASYRWGDAVALLPESESIPYGMQNDAIKGKERKGKEKKGKESKEEERKRELNFYSLEDFKPLWEKWIEYKATEHKDRYKTIETEQLALDKLIRISEKNSKIAEQIVNESRENRWKGLFPLKPNNYAVNQRTPISKPVPQGNIPRNGFGKL